MMILISIGICGYFIKMLWDKWRDTPVIVTFAETSVPIREVRVIFHVKFIGSFNKICTGFKFQIQFFELQIQFFELQIKPNQTYEIKNVKNLFRENIASKKGDHSYWFC